jgi:hypothetical protein
MACNINIYINTFFFFFFRDLWSDQGNPWSPIDPSLLPTQDQVDLKVNWQCHSHKVE